MSRVQRKKYCNVCLSVDEGALQDCHGSSTLTTTIFTYFFMFTGIIEATAEVLEKSDSALKVERPQMFDDIKIGSSISVHGVCLSVVSFDDTSMKFDVVGETWSRSNLGELEVGSSVNVERAMPVNGRFDGHIVQGHVEAVGNVTKVARLSAGVRLEIKIPKELIKYCIQKGSITLNGVSLTISEQKSNSISVALVPHTVEHTTVVSIKEGDSSNIETDILGKYVEELTVQK